MSGDPLLGFTRHADKGLKVIETERGPIAPCPELILAPFSLVFSQIVALMLPHRSWFAGLLLRGAGPILTVLLRRTICNHLRRARPEKNPQWISANTRPVFPGLRPRIWPHLLRLVTKGNVGQAPCHLVSSFLK
jgi:hypothetical protein